MSVDTIKAINKALEGVTPGPWEAESGGGKGAWIKGSDGNWAAMSCGTDNANADANARYIAAVNPAAVTELISEIDRLQRENAALKIDASNHAADAETVRREREVERRRAEAAEDEVKRLRNKVAARALTDRQLLHEIKAIDEACKGGFGEGGGSPGEWWYERADELEHERKRRELESQLQQHTSRTALASTGGEHNAE